jgi:hypothetical protein
LQQNDTIADQLRREQDAVNALVRFFGEDHDFDRVIYTDWTAKDVFAHLVMWHESFAHIILAIIQGEKPTLLPGLLHEINENGVKEYKKYRIDELLKKMKTAQEIIERNIGSEKIGLIPYRKDSKRIYSREKHLEIVCQHITGHFAHILKKYT